MDSKEIKNKDISRMQFDNNKDTLREHLTDAEYAKCFPNEKVDISASNNDGDRSKQCNK